MKKMGEFYNAHTRKKEVLEILRNILIIIFSVGFLGIILFMDGSSDLFYYPENDYEYLETVVSKVVVDNSINLNLLDERTDIDYTVSYNKKIEETEWSSCDIELKKADSVAMVNATIKKNTDSTLRIIIKERDSKFDIIVLSIFVLLIDILISVVVAMIISAIIYACLLISIYIICIIKEKRNNKRNTK